MTCTVPGCTRPYCAKGYCRPHYNRARSGVPLDAPIREYGRAPAPCAIAGCGRTATTDYLCSTHYERRRTGDPRTDIWTPPPPVNREPRVRRARPRGTPEVRFAAKWVLDSDTGCHLWTDHLVSGYGQFRVTTGIQKPAHVWAWEQENGPMPDGMVLDHTCHPTDGTCLGGEGCVHRSCVNARHCTPTSRGDNSRRSVRTVLH